MIKLDELPEELVNWYCGEIKPKVEKRIEECKEIFKEESENINNKKILEELEKIQKNLDKFLKIDDLKDKDLKIDHFLRLISKNKDYICNLQEIKKNKNKKELLDEYNENCVRMNMAKLDINNKEIIVEIIKNKIDELNNKNDEIKKKLNDSIKKNKEDKEIDKLNKKIDKIKKNKEMTEIKYKNIFTYIFDYEMLESEKNQVTLRHRILSKMGVKTCPYCDRQYITNYNESSSTADLDHFYSQSKYPYLALNIYNFIPSCAVCNRNFKKSKEIKINPRVEEFGENGIFKLENIVDNIMDVELKDIEIEILSKGDRKNDIDENIEIFKLREVYKIHNDYVLQMIKDITFRGNESYLETFKEFFKGSSMSEDKIISKLKEMILKPYKFKIDGKEPLGKLTKDILDDIEKNYK